MASKQEKTQDQLVTETETELLKGLRSGDSASFESLVRTYSPRILAIARRYLRSEADAADTLQDTFVQVFKHIESFEGRSSLWYWIRGIAIKQCLMRLRQRRRRPEESIEHLLPVFDANGHRIESSELTTDGLDAPQQTMDVQRFVMQAIDSLPDSYRTVLFLRYIDGYTTRETADTLDIQRNAVKTRLHRARSALKKLLEPVMDRDQLL